MVEIHFPDGGYYKGNMTDGIITGQGDYQSAFNEVKLTITVFCQSIIGTVYEYLYVYVCMYACKLFFCFSLERTRFCRETSKTVYFTGQTASGRMWRKIFTLVCIYNIQYVCMYVWIIYIEFRFEILV